MTVALQNLDLNQNFRSILLSKRGRKLLTKFSLLYTVPNNELGCAKTIQYLIRFPVQCATKHDFLLPAVFCFLSASQEQKDAMESEIRNAADVAFHGSGSSIGVQGFGFH